jgi:N-acetylglucosamine kinase-like BadF-type ATPase
MTTARPGRQSDGRGPTHDVVLGIDAGGTRTRARAVLDGAVVHEGEGGPGNPQTTQQRHLHDSYRQALAGCPPPARIGACIAGVEDPEQRDRMHLLLRTSFPGATVRVAPDYVAALRAAPPGTDVCVIAGTGSLVCSATGAAGYVRSGGRGWILGDHGSGARLGQAFLERFTDAPESAPAHLTSAVRALYGTADWRRLVSEVHRSATPAAWLARAAALLTGEAERGAEWAAHCLDSEMSALARTTSRHIDRHIDRHIAGDGAVQVALAGGLWTSGAVFSAFTAALSRYSDRIVHVQRSTRAPLDGAVQFAAEATEAAEGTA